MHANPPHTPAAAPLHGTRRDVGLAGIRRTGNSLKVVRPAGSSTSTLAPVQHARKPSRSPRKSGHSTHLADPRVRNDHERQRVRRYLLIFRSGEELWDHVCIAAM